VCTVVGLTPTNNKTTLNNHYSAGCLEPWGARSQRGYGIETLERFVREVAEVEFGGPASDRKTRLLAAQTLAYDDLAADRQTVAAVQALEAILDRQYRGRPDCVARVNDRRGGLVLYDPNGGDPEVLYGPAV
jgi:hypothetical protein